jgi:O-acetyl-ADP-ribose deacetylase (regulator of RNase III)
MEAQGHEEPVGKAKITGGYNLPARHVIHTVGPVVGVQVTEKQKEELASCYRSCLKLAEKSGLKSVAFCCISTGEFHFPGKLAARIAVETIDRYLSGSRLERVVIDVFKEEDLHIYQKIFR